MSLQKTQDFFKEVNLENGSNYKIELLKKYQNPLLQKILKMAYDRVSYVYGVSLNSVKNFEFQGAMLNRDLSEALEDLEMLSSRTITGHTALKHIVTVMDSLPDFETSIIERIIDRDMRINMGTTQINKVFPGLIQKPVYMRCSTYSEKTAKKIKYPAICQLKADGLACFTHVTSNEVICYTRSGETFKLNSIQYLSNKRELHNKIIQGELLIEGELDRAISNGEINSLIKFRQGNNSSIDDNDADIIESRLLYQVWDIITESEWLNAQNKIKCNIPYKERFEEILGINWTNGNI